MLLKLSRKFSTPSAVSSLISNALLESQSHSIASSDARAWRFTTATISTSPQKALLAVRMLKGMSLPQAQTQLRFSKKKTSVRVLAMLNRGFKAINHNTAYARSLDQSIREPPSDPAKLMLHRVIVNKGIYRPDIRLPSGLYPQDAWKGHVWQGSSSQLQGSNHTEGDSRARKG